MMMIVKNAIKTKTDDDIPVCVYVCTLYDTFASVSLSRNHSDVICSGGRKSMCNFDANIPFD